MGDTHMTSKPYAYIAGPLFDEGERWFIEKVDRLVAENLSLIHI